jgi:hypothetical protein
MTLVQEHSACHQPLSGIVQEQFENFQNHSLEAEGNGQPVAAFAAAVEKLQSTLRKMGLDPDAGK